MVFGNSLSTVNAHCTIFGGWPDCSIDWKAYSVQVCNVCNTCDSSCLQFVLIVFNGLFGSDYPVCSFEVCQFIGHAIPIIILTIFSKPIVMDAAVSAAAIAIVTIQIPTFHVRTLDPSRFPIGSRLNTAKKLLTE